MNEYFSHQERFAANMKKEIVDDFDAGERRAGDNFCEPLKPTLIFVEILLFLANLSR